MGCCGTSKNNAGLKNDVKWDYVNFDVFKSQSCFTPLAYAYLWLMLFVSISVYAVDTFIAINLLAFNKWSGQVEPAIPFKISKWIFAGCIILSFVLLIERWIRAVRVMKKGKVARNYLDPLAVRVQCIRRGQRGQGWKRFLVFAELTKSRKGADYVALFAYFSFEAWLRIVFAEGPRQVINGITLYSVMKADLIPAGEHAAPEGKSPFIQFWDNVGILADANNLQAVILFAMLWTLIIWLVSAISLALSAVLYLLFLWHHIPNDAGGLTGYCRSKINRRMQRIVKFKTEKALKQENERRARLEAQAYREGQDCKRQPTLPDLENGSKATPSWPTLSRQTTTTTLPEYSSRPGTAMGQHDVPHPMPTPAEFNGRPPPTRHMTNASDASWSSYNSNAPLIGAAGDRTHSLSDRAQTPGSMHSRSQRNFSHDRSFSGGPPRPPTAQSSRNGSGSGSYQMEPIHRPGTAMSGSSRPVRLSAESEMLPPPPRGLTPGSGTSPTSPSSAHSAPWSDNQSRRIPTPGHNACLPPISPIPESRGESIGSHPHRPPGPPLRSFTQSPSSTMPAHPAVLSRAQTSDDVGSPYAPFHPNRAMQASPVHSGSSYRSYTQTPPPISGRRTPPGGLTPSGHTTPPRKLSGIDDILDHY